MPTQQIPHLSDYPEYAEAAALRDRIAAEFRRVRRRKDELRASHPRPASQIPIDSLRGGEVNAETSPSSWREEMQQLGERVADALEKRGTLSGDDVRRLIAGEPLRSRRFSRQGFGRLAPNLASPGKAFPALPLLALT
ncbi:MAG: hypothetical protein WD737_08490 [Gemmatimonadota bacterium]